MLGAKWKELDEEEKKVSLQGPDIHMFFYAFWSGIHSLIAGSPCLDVLFLVILHVELDVMLTDFPLFF